MEKNFEITMYLLNQIKKYADFFHYADKKMMSILFVTGLNIFETEAKEDGINNTITKMRQSIRCLEQPYNDYWQGDEEDIEKEKVLDKEKEKAEARERKLKRRKMRITMEQNAYIKKLTKKLSVNDEKFNDSDIICCFLSYGLEQLKYLNNQYEWGTDLCSDEDFMKPKEICTTIPYAFYMCILNMAVQFNISVDDYIKILIEKQFDENQEEMKKQIKEQVKARSR